MLNCVDGCIPSDLGTGSDAEIEEERRLLYVAMTRAKEALHMVTPLRFYVHGQASRGDKHLYAGAEPLPASASPAALRAARLDPAAGRSGRAAPAPTAARPEAADAEHVGVAAAGSGAFSYG